MTPVVLCGRAGACVLCLLGVLAASAPARAQQPPAPTSFDADVVVLSDTSKSMTENDPRNAVVLVSRLFADIVPGKLAAVRLLDIGRDRDKAPMHPTGQTRPCPDRPSEPCDVYDFAPGAEQKVVDLRLLLSDRGMPGFKANLVPLLQPSAASTNYYLSFQTVEQVFRDHNSPETTPRVVVWLSDGAADAVDWPRAKPVLQKLVDQGVRVHAFIFKSGTTSRVKEVGIEGDLIDGSPRALMTAFADAFRQIVQAPFRVNNIVAQNPTFEIKPFIENLWVVIYGDESLGAASISSNGRTVQADYAADRYNGSAYRVVSLTNPPAGSWTVSASGGGVGVSYAVIQRSTIVPVATAPSNVLSGVPFNLEVVLRAGQTGQILTPADLPEPVVVEAQVDGVPTVLHDDGTNGDQTRGDGRFTAAITARKTGPIDVVVRAHNSFLDRRVTVPVTVSGSFRYTGAPLDIVFTAMKAGDPPNCQPLSYTAEQDGAVPFELRQIAALPAHLHLELHVADKTTAVGGSPITLMREDAKQICLVADRDADSSRSQAQSWAALAVNGRTDPESVVGMRMTWSVASLTFWERWRRIILLILAGLLVAIVIYGYIKPHRFAPGLALCFAPAMNELDDQTPQPVRLWKGTKIGFYRDARACLQDNFRVNGHAKGAVAILRAGPRRAVFLEPGSRPLYREVGLGEWDEVPAKGRRAGQGEIYRCSDSGPYFRLSMRMMS